MLHSTVIKTIHYRNSWFLKLVANRQLSNHKQTSYYEILGVSPRASQTEIKRAYFKLCALYHPDKVGSGNLDRFQEITKAYEILCNYNLRRQYDRGYSVTSYQIRPDTFEEDDQVHHIKYDKPIPKFGKNPIYNLDEAVKQSQTEAFKKGKEKFKKLEPKNVDVTGLIIILLAVTVVYVIFTSIGKHNDKSSNGDKPNS